jgi:hypothetical protein
MIGESVSDQHKQAIARLRAQTAEYLATGKRIQDIPPGASANANANAPMFGTTSRTKKTKVSATNASTD